MIPEFGITWEQVKVGLASAEREYAESRWWQPRRRHRALNRLEGYGLLMRACEAKPDRHNL